MLISSQAKKQLKWQITDTNNQLNDAKKDLGNQIADTNKNLNDAKNDLGNQITDTNQVKQYQIFTDPN